MSNQSQENYYKKDFETLEWKLESEGKYIAYITLQTNSLRLMKVNDQFLEQEWCENGHQGIIFKGSASILFEETIINYKEGDTILIPSGPEHRHKLIISPGQEAIICLIE